MLMETSRDKIDKIFDEESFVLELNVNIITWIYLFNGTLLCFIMNLYVSFGIPFDPKRYYKDGDYTLLLQRLRYQGLEYTDMDIADFEERLEMIYSREIHRVQVVDFQGMLELMRDGLFVMIVMEHCDDVGVVVFASRAWGRDPVLRLYHWMMAHSNAGRSWASEKFVARLAEHFGLLTAEILGGLTVIAPELLIIDMGELLRLQICMEVDDTWAWVAMGPERAGVTYVPYSETHVPYQRCQVRQRSGEASTSAA
ncbi:hypothetical protein Tco_1360144 [Tanacetum coccineum]